MIKKMKNKTIILAYSGGLDTSYCLKKLSKEHQDSKLGIQTTDYIKKYGTHCYSIYVRQKPSTEDMWDMPDVGGFYAFALAYDLGKLKHLEEYGINLENL